MTTEYHTCATEEGQRTDEALREGDAWLEERRVRGGFTVEEWERLIHGSEPVAALLREMGR